MAYAILPQHEDCFTCTVIATRISLKKTGKLREVLKNKSPVSHAPVPNRERKTRAKISSKPGGEDAHFSQPGFLEKIREA